MFAGNSRKLRKGSMQIRKGKSTLRKESSWSLSPVKVVVYKIGQNIVSKWKINHWPLYRHYSNHRRHSFYDGNYVILLFAFFLHFLYFVFIVIIISYFIIIVIIIVLIIIIVIVIFIIMIENGLTNLILVFLRPPGKLAKRN